MTQSQQSAGLCTTPMWHGIDATFGLVNSNTCRRMVDQRVTRAQRDPGSHNKVVGTGASSVSLMPLN